MPTGDLVPSSDGRFAVNVGPWAKEKLFYVARYCHIFNTGMKGRWNVRTYIDLFSGPGKCVIEGTDEELDGSPLVAIGCEVPFTHYIFNDIEPTAIEALRDRIGSLGFPKAAINYFSADCNDVIADILQQLPKASLDFCLIDPTNWQIRFDSIARLTKNRRMDLAITFHSGSMKRVAELNPEELNDFFGGSKWHERYRNMLASGRHEGSRVLLDTYEEGLRTLGYRHLHDYILVKNEKGVPLYHLLFASKSPRGRDFWDKISQRSATGQYKFPMPQA